MFQGLSGVARRPGAIAHVANRMHMLDAQKYAPLHGAPPAGAPRVALSRASSRR